MSYTKVKSVNFGSARSGLLTVGYTLTGGARVTSGVAETVAGSGCYAATVTFAAGFSGTITWDTGGSGPAYAAEDINPGSDEFTDVGVSTRSTFAGGAVASVAGSVGSVAAPVTVGTSNDKTGYSLNLAQTGLAPRALDAVADSALTVGDALVAAIAAAAGKESTVGTAYAVKTPFTGTVIRSFTLDSPTDPTSRS